MLPDHVINSPYAERPEGSRKLSLLFAQTFGTVRSLSLEAKFLETMRVFEELRGNVNHFSKSQVSYVVASEAKQSSNFQAVFG